VNRTIGLIVNGSPEQVTIKEHWTLIDLLRQGLSLLGTEEGCGEGVCGSCTVILDGRLVRSCLYLAVRAEGKNVRTVEGLARGEQMSPLQEAFVDCGAVQCGFCIPGFLMATAWLLDQDPPATDQEIREHLSGNLCRCGGYPQILAAARRSIDAAGGNRAG
jgi:aerobic-type carbon monoxide dehydrogenase small subunit (CoxS/CutS family)